MTIKQSNRIPSDEKEMTDLTITLLHQFQEGDDQVFSQLYDLHVNLMYNYGRRLIADKELLKDCIHDVFVKVYAKRSEMSGIENFKSYILISLKNRICDEIRKRIYLSNATIEDVDPVSTDDVERRYLDREAETIGNHTLKNLMEQLSPRQREALTLYYIEERKYEDICEIMSMNYQSVRNLMCRGLTKLRSIAAPVQ